MASQCPIFAPDCSCYWTRTLKLWVKTTWQIDPSWTDCFFLHERGERRGHVAFLTVSHVISINSHSHNQYIDWRA